MLFFVTIKLIYNTFAFISLSISLKVNSYKKHFMMPTYYATLKTYIEKKMLQTCFLLKRQCSQAQCRLHFADLNGKKWE